LNNPHNPFTPSKLPIKNRTFIAPYWSDVDTTGIGRIYYRQTNNPALLVRTTNEIQRVFPMSQDVNVTNLFIVTWDVVGYYDSHTDKVRSCNLIYTYRKYVTMLNFTTVMQKEYKIYKLMYFLKPDIVHKISKA